MLATQIEAQVWLRGLMLIAVGVVLVTVATTRPDEAIGTTGAEEAAGAGVTEPK
ncbi:hypothetical protein [Streptomyces sp. NBC_00887]|uniref:hypothetical protein n=1 Tax=Streptomyces sp. NBC_00887 TaxID=2975859 RepID=UPI002F90D676